MHAPLRIEELRSNPAQGDLPPLLARVYGNRGIRRAEEMDTALSGLLPPAGLPDIECAASRLADAIARSERIVIVGDFDADGATSVALSVLVLKAMGAEHVDYAVPNRFEFGYGLSPEIVDFVAAVQPDVIVTVDNGVASIQGAARARALGIDVIITDHHLPGSALPDVVALVNPNLVDAPFDSKALAGVGVIYYVLGVLRRVLRERGWFAQRGLEPPNMADYLDLVALGTVADVVPLDRNNRILVHQGLRRIRAGRARPGINVLLELGKRDRTRVTASDLGYAVGPRLNAAGRLDDMTIGIRCLLAETPAEARRLAVALDQLNAARREIESSMLSEAERIVAAYGSHAQVGHGIALYDAGWHQGVVGIVAGRLKDRLNRPVIAFADAGDAAPDELKGSARSIPDLHIRDLLDALATRYPGLLIRFGGHAMAAGLSLKRVHFERFRKAFDRAVAAALPAHDGTRVVWCDGKLQAREFSLANAEALQFAGPWGQQFPEPLFVGEFEVISHRVVGERHLKLVFGFEGALLDAIAFNVHTLPSEPRVRAVYRLARNDFGPAPTLQLVVEHLLPYV